MAKIKKEDWIVQKLEKVCLRLIAWVDTEEKIKVRIIRKGMKNFAYEHKETLLCLGLHDYYKYPGNKLQNLEDEFAFLVGHELGHMIWEEFIGRKQQKELQKIFNEIIENPCVTDSWN